MTWAQRLKRVFNIDIEVCGHCGGSVKIIACIEDQDIIDRILAHLRDKELATPSLPLLTPPSRAPPETLPLFAGKDSSSTALNQQGSQRVVTAEKFVGTELFVPGFEGERKRSTRPAMRVLTAGTARACIHDLMLPRPLSGRPVTPDTPFILLILPGRRNGRDCDKEWHGRLPASACNRPPPRSSRSRPGRQTPEALTSPRVLTGRGCPCR